MAAPAAVSTVAGVSTIAVGTAANAASYAGGYVTTNATLNLGARAVTVPLAYRVAANAAVFAATKMNPYVAAASLAAAAIPFAVDWFSRSPNPLEVSPDGFVRVPAQPGGTFGDVMTDNGLTVTQRMASYVGSFHCPCQSSGPASRVSTCNGGYGVGVVDKYGTGIDTICFGDTAPVAPPPVPARAPTTVELEQLGSVPLNPALLPYIGDSIPVDPVPVINPASAPIGDVVIGPSGNPAPAVSPAPLRVPDGEPVPIPNTSPQQYEQPWLEIVPSPTTAEPLRVDVRPITTVTTNPVAPLDPVTVPDPSTGNPSPTTGQTDCDKYPGSLGCIPVGDIPDVEIPTDEREIQLQDGPAFGGGSCPPDLVINLHGTTVTALDMSVACGWISNLMRPLVLLLASISAIFIVAPKPEN